MKAEMKCLGISILFWLSFVLAASNAYSASKVENKPLTPTGEKLRARYETMLTELKAEIVKSLPNLKEENKKALQQARDAVKKAEASADAAQKAIDKLMEAKALVEHAKNKWIGGAEKGIAQA